MQKEGHCDRQIEIKWIGHIVWKFLANSDSRYNKKNPAFECKQESLHML